MEIGEIVEVVNRSLTGGLLEISSQELINIISWLKSCGLLVTYDLIVGDSFKSIAFFNDCGIVSCLINNTIISKLQIESLLSETFILNELNK